MTDADSSTNLGSKRRAGLATARRSAILLAALLILAVVFLIWAHRQSYRVVAHWPQASSEQYGAGGPYHFLVVEGSRDWRGFPFSFGRNYFLLVGREISGDQEGYRVDHSFHPTTADVEAHIRNCSVEWAPLGVWFQEPSGQRLFIPKEAFAFGP
jgi:hypothetical protein